MRFPTRTSRRFSRAAALLALSSVCSVRTLAQEKLSTDRPGLGLSTSTLDPGRFQLELGLPTFTFVRGDGTDLRAWSTPYLLRYGLSGGVEVRLSGSGWNDVRDESSGSTFHGFGDVELGAKFELLHGAGWTPSLALVGGVRLPTGDDGFTTHEPGYDLTLAAGWSPGERDSFGMTIGAIRLPIDPDYVTTGVLTGTFAHSFDERWSAYAELGWLAGLHAARDQALWGLGATYLLTHDVQLDLSGDFALSDETPDAVLGVGVSVRF